MKIYEAGAEAHTLAAHPTNKPSALIRSGVLIPKFRGIVSETN